MSAGKRLALGAAALLALYWIAAYWVIPAIWARYELRLNPDRAMLTATPQGIPGDPINVGLVGSEEDVLRAFHEAAWSPADPVTLASGIKIGLSVILDRPYKDAPISTLIYEGRKQDLAFEKQAGPSAGRRHHVRLWRIAETAQDGRTIWLGSASFDRGVGVSHDTGQVTHHISPDVDAERDYLVGNLDKAGAVEDSFTVPGRGATWEGRNGGGDLYFTDGRALIGILKPTGQGG